MMETSSFGMILVLLLVFETTLVVGINKRNFDEIKEENRFNGRCLKYHNLLRLLHGSPSLIWDDAIAESSQGHANYLTTIQEMVHSDGSKYGENLYVSSDPDDIDLICEYACKAWYSEVKKYNFETGGFSMDTGHFTQLIWKSSERVGVGESGRAGANFYIVARYHPPGNMEGEFESNVQPLQKELPVSCLSELKVKLETAVKLVEHLGAPNPSKFFVNNSKPCDILKRTNKTGKTGGTPATQGANGMKQGGEDLLAAAKQPLLFLVPINEPEHQSVTLRPNTSEQRIQNPSIQVNNSPNPTTSNGSSEATHSLPGLPMNPKDATTAHDITPARRKSISKKRRMPKH